MLVFLRKSSEDELSTLEDISESVFTNLLIFISISEILLLTAFACSKCLLNYNLTLDFSLVNLCLVFETWLFKLVSIPEILTISEFNKDRFFSCVSSLLEWPSVNKRRFSQEVFNF